MKQQWRGVAYKNHLWRCATATTIQEFNRFMQEFKTYSEPAFNWLVKIPPAHWARSHFDGRAKSDVLINNMCETLNSRLVKGREMPIIHCLEFIREYLMLRIGNVVKAIEKCKGPLTPTATRVFEVIKKEAEAYTCLFNGKDLYQVSGPWGDQCVVNITNRTCSCRKWEITGMPCKHVICVNWDMATNGVVVDPVEAWVDPYYRLETWKLMYQFTINPTNGVNMWTAVPDNLTTIIPPKYHTPIGRPKKKRRKTADEIQMSKSSKLSRKLRAVVCTNCGNMCHNKRSCKKSKGESSKAQSSKGKTAKSQKVRKSTKVGKKASGGPSQVAGSSGQVQGGPTVFHSPGGKRCVFKSSKPQC